jgi:hypothetical protein
MRADDQVGEGGTGTYHALQQAMSIGSQSQESQVFLLGLMDKLEAVRPPFPPLQLDSTSQVVLTR